MTTTSNLGLTKPQMADVISSSIPAIAANFDIIDTEITNLKKIPPYINILNPPQGIASAATDGFTDISSTLQACVDYLSTNGGGMVYIPYLAAGFKISNQINWKSNVGLFSNGSLITATSQPTTTYLNMFFLNNVVNVTFTGKLRVKATANNQTRTSGFSGLGSNVRAIWLGGNSQNIRIDYVYGENLENVIDMQGIDPSTSKNVSIKEIESLDTYTPFFVNLFSLVNVDYIHSNVVAITMDAHDHIVYTNDKCYDITFGTVQGTSASTVPVYAVQMYPTDLLNGTLTSKRVTFNTIKLNGCWNGFVGAMCEGVWVGELTANLTNGGTVLGAFDGAKYEVGNVTVDGNFDNFLSCIGSASFLNQLTIHGGKINGSVTSSGSTYIVRADFVDRLNINNVEFNNITSAFNAVYVPANVATNSVTFANCLFVFQTVITASAPFHLDAGTVKFKECEFINKQAVFGQIINAPSPCNVKMIRCTMSGFTNFFLIGMTGTGKLFDSVLLDDNSIMNGSAGNELKRLYGAGSPETVITAPIGSEYFRNDGGASTSMYIKQSGTGNTGWIGK